MTTRLLDATPPHAIRWSRRDYYRLAELGFFEGRRVMLIHGEVVEMPPQSNYHSVGIELASEALRVIFPHGYRFRIQMPFNVGRTSDPEPDIAVVPGDPRESTDHPATAALVVEVSESSLSLDREKAGLYAGAKVPEYWILNLAQRCLDVYRRPVRSGRGGRRYAETETFGSTESVAPVAAPKSKVRVADLLP